MSISFVIELIGIKSGIDVKLRSRSILAEACLLPGQQVPDLFGRWTLSPPETVEVRPSQDWKPLDEERDLTCAEKEVGG